MSQDKRQRVSVGLAQKVTNTAEDGDVSSVPQTFSLWPEGWTLLLLPIFRLIRFHGDELLSLRFALSLISAGFHLLQPKPVPRRTELET